MNVVVSIVFIIFFFEMLRRKRNVSSLPVFLTVFGAVLPLGDYVTRFFRSLPLFHSCDTVFQSFPYQGIFWSIAVAYCWIATRDFKRSLVFYLPLLGLGFYAFFSILGTDSVPFFFPLSNFGVGLGLVKEGYLIVLIPISLLWMTKRWLRLSLSAIGWLSFSYLTTFVLLMAILRTVISNSLVEPIGNLEEITIVPANHYHTEWIIVAKSRDRYYSDRYKLFAGLQNDLQTQPKFDDFESMQNILLHPAIHCLYFRAFKHPIAKIDIRKERLFVQFNEFVPLNELFGIDKLVVIQNRSGQIVDFQVNYRFLYRKSATFRL